MSTQAGASVLDRPVPGSVTRSLMPVEPVPAEAFRWEYSSALKAAAARRDARWFLRHCRAPEELTDTTELLVSELVTNAVIAEARLPPPGIVELFIRRFTDRWLIEVTDSSPETRPA